MFVCLYMYMCSCCTCVRASVTSVRICALITSFIQARVYVVTGLTDERTKKQKHHGRADRRENAPAFSPHTPNASNSAPRPSHSLLCSLCNPRFLQPLSRITGRGTAVSRARKFHSQHSHRRLQQPGSPRVGRLGPLGQRLRAGQAVADSHVQQAERR